MVATTIPLVGFELVPIGEPPLIATALHYILIPAGGVSVYAHMSR
jgi:hypothetical protein